MAELISSRQDIIAQIHSFGSISMNCAGLMRGIDNYHVDVHLSDLFVKLGQTVIKDVVSRVVAENRVVTGAKEDLQNFRNAYGDMMKTTLYRVKTDLDLETIHFLQFGVIKFVLKEVLQEMQTVVDQLEEKLGQQQFAGSRNLLPTQEKFAWLRRHYNEFMYRSNRAILQQLQREENSRLREIRQQLAPGSFPELLNIMFNPMLSAVSPSDINMTVECYSLWPNGGTGFTAANRTLEEMLATQLPDLEISPLNVEKLEGSTQKELYATLNGLFSSQELLGPSENQNEQVHEELGWLEQPGNLRLLFDNKAHESSIAEVKDALGLKATWSFKADVKKLLKTAADIRRSMFTDFEMKEAIAALVLREKWSTSDQDLLELPLACAYIAGHDAKKILARIESKEFTGAFIKRLDGLVEEVNRQFKEETEEKFLRILTDLSRFRLHLKYHRFAHRLLNRINVILEPDKVQLARSGGNLYELLGATEFKVLETAEPEIIHHIILKAEVSGSTGVIKELVDRDLNPASYFSFRLFDPINALLEKHDAIKVFNEGDAITLSIYEKSNQPQHWYCVSRACGMAREILDVVASKNLDSIRTGLPKLELGISIGYADSKPLFLFDEKRPIMISSAIGEVAGLSSEPKSNCSESDRLGNQGQFHVEVFLSGANSKPTYCKKNGILLSDSGFKKLMSEISLKHLKVKSSDSSVTMLVGTFPDLCGKERYLVVRRGVVRIRQRGELRDSGQFFYEVISNTRFANQIVELSRQQQK